MNWLISGYASCVPGRHCPSAHQRLQERDDTQYNQVVERAVGNTYNFACRAKQDSYNVCPLVLESVDAADTNDVQETTRVRYAINRIIPLNYREEAKFLANILTHSDWAR